MQQNNQKPKRKGFDWLFLILVIIAIIGVYLFIQHLTTPTPKQLSYAELVEALSDEKNTIETSTLVAQPIGGQNENMFTLTGKYKDGTSFECNITMDQFNALTGGESPVMIRLISLNENVFLSLVITLLPYGLLIAFFIYIFKSQGNNKAFDFAKSNARLVKGKTVTFADVAGCDEEKEEMVEIIDFLKNPRKYSEIGARIPKGVLLIGPPGTGKTLMAKAVAGEAEVPFFSISGSDFVEMFVGVGASRVRDMFKIAKEHAPCIVFIDEIDAVGRQRGTGMGGGHDEREQTLNQLLVEMDGFNNNLGIIVMAATNRPDVLDPALLRPGRFDRQITISNPDVNGREAILKVHARNKHLDKDVNLADIAHRIPGFSGADIENLLNEAALLAARDNRRLINTQDIDEAVDRVLMGPAKKTRKISDEERKRVAYHEAGHAVIGLKVENSNIVQKVTIVPRGQAGGYALMPPKEDKYNETEQSLLDTITGYLGGRVSEEINFNEVSTGAAADFKQATRIARSMVTIYGMSNLGPIQYEDPQGNVFLGRDYLKEKNFSDQIALEIDKETRRIIEECYARAKKVLLENIDLLKSIAEYLIKVETLTKTDIDEIEATGHLKRYDEKDTNSEEPKATATAKDFKSEESNNDVKKDDTQAQEAKTDKTDDES